MRAWTVLQGVDAPLSPRKGAAVAQGDKPGHNGGGDRCLYEPGGRGVAAEGRWVRKGYFEEVRFPFLGAGGGRAREAGLPRRFAPRNDGGGGGGCGRNGLKANR